MRAARTTTDHARLLALHHRHLTLEILRLYLITIVVQAQVFNLQVEHMHLIEKLTILHLEMDLPLVGFAQLTKQLLSVSLELLKLSRFGHDGLELVAVASRRVMRSRGGARGEATARSRASRLGRPVASARRSFLLQRDSVTRA